MHKCIVHKCKVQQQTTREGYAHRLERVLTFMSDHLDDNINLDQMAEIAFFSRFHFLRIYRQMLGETPLQTLRRMRLHRAAVQLIQSDCLIQDIATEAGYNSAEAFSRSFSAVYGHAPRDFRSQRQSVGVTKTPLLATKNKEHHCMHNMHSITIKEYPRLHLCGLAHTGDYQKIGDTFDRVFLAAAAVNAVNEQTRSIGIYYDDHETIEACKLRSFAGITLPENQNTPQGLKEISLAAGKGAHLTHKGPYADLEKAYAYLYAEWLPQSGYEPADIPVFEEYLNDCKTLPATEWLTQIILPLKALS